MAKGNRGGRRAGAGASINQSHSGIQFTGGGGATVGGAYTQMTDSQAQQLRDDMEESYEPDVTNAIKMYISATDANGDGYSYSQNLNYKLDNGIPLDVNERYIDTYIQKGMHTIGQDTVLFRACHDDILQKAGIPNYASMSESQLQSALVGRTFTATSYMSTSYDRSKNPFYHGNGSSGVSGGREVYMNINAGANTRMVFGAKKQSEMVLDKGTNFRITGIRYDGTYATPRNGGVKPRVIIDIETY